MSIPRCAPLRFLRLAAVLALIMLAGCERGQPVFRSTDVTGAGFGRELSLTDHTGRPRTLADFRGKVVVLFFGFTRCPDVCPTTLARLKQVMETLGPQAERVQVLFVTLDPERDTQALLAQYVPYFDPRFLGLYGDLQATDKAAKEFKIFYEKRPGSTPQSYTMDHTAASFVFDPQGRLRLFVRDENLPMLPEDIRTLLDSR